MYTLSEITKKLLLNLIGTILSGLVLIGISPKLYAQTSPFPDTILKEQLARAEAYLLSFKNDSAQVVANELVNVLKVQGKIDTPFGIHAQLAEALAAEQDQQGDLAIKKLLHIAEVSQAKKIWDVHIRACLALALLYEKVGRKESSRRRLNLAHVHIERYGLDSLYSYYAIRRSSWERLYGKHELALHFAREALRSSSQHHQILEEAIGHMLMNMLLPETSQTERMYHCKKAVKRYQQLDDHTGCSYMWGAIASIHEQRKNLHLALAYNDSTLMAANRAIAAGHEKFEAIGKYYRFRSQIFRQMGLLDSALVNMQKGYEMELAVKDKYAADKIVEIDARYQNSFKQQQIEDQQLALRMKNNQLRLSFIIVVLVVLLATGLWFGFQKQRRTNQKLARQNILIQEQAAQLENLDAAKSRFFANVSHELRTPLALIMGPITSLLNDNYRTDKQTRLLNTAIRSARQLETMVNDILDLRKLEVGKMSLHPEPTRLASFFRLHFDQFQSLAQWKQIDYTHDIRIDPDFVGEIDREKCRQILYNLLSNAFKFTPAHEKVEVLVRLSNSRLSVQVADTGPGIHPDDVAHIFKRFYQTGQKGTYLGGGTGIGLSLCHDYARLMGGDIQVKSSLGVGSTFLVCWPVSVIKQAETSVVPALVPPPTSECLAMDGKASVQNTGKTFKERVSATKPTIMVVEDNPGLQAYMSLILSDEYRVLTAENGEVAFRQLSACADTIDLVLSDLMMPVMDGHQLLKKLRSHDTTRHLPVIMLTARADPADRLQALRIGVDDYLTKPFDEAELRVRIANLLKNQAVRRQEALLETPDSDCSLLLSEADRAWLEKFENYIRENLDSDIMSVATLSETFAMSESTLFRQLKRLTGLSTQQYLQEIRLNEARLMLEKSAFSSIASLASQVGYKDARTFSRSYKKRFGKLPTEYA